MGKFRKPTAACLNACRRSSWKINPLRRTSADYAQLKQILGAEQIEAMLNAAKRLKQSEKGCKQLQRSVDHGVR